MPDEVNARHRAGGLGRLITLRNATPRHAASTPAPGAIPLRPWALLVLPLLLLAGYFVHRSDRPQAAVPLPAVSVPPRATSSGTSSPSAGPRPLRAVPQARKATIALPRPATSAAARSRSAKPAAAPLVLLGPATDRELPPLLTSYCQATQGRFTVAMSTRTGWVCAGFGRAATIDMDAMCRWRYGDQARAVQGNATDPRSWRCYRDGP